MFAGRARDEWVSAVRMGVGCNRCLQSVRSISVILGNIGSARRVIGLILVDFLIALRLRLVTIIVVSNIARLSKRILGICRRLFGGIDGDRREHVVSGTARRRCAWSGYLLEVCLVFIVTGAATFLADKEQGCSQQANNDQPYDRESARYGTRVCEESTRDMMRCAGENNGGTDPVALLVTEVAVPGRIVEVVGITMMVVTGAGATAGKLDSGKLLNVNQYM